jgi:hypothetical protein
MIEYYLSINGHPSPLWNREAKAWFCFARIFNEYDIENGGTSMCRVSVHPFPDVHRVISSTNGWNYTTVV